MQQDEEMTLSDIKGGFDWILGKILYGKGSQALEEAVQGSGGHCP